MNYYSPLIDDPRLPQRFWDKVTPEPNTGCWLWTGYIDKKGYGCFRDNRKVCRSYRYAYEHLTGPIPVGIHLHHCCRQPMCVNISHLQLITQAQHSIEHHNISVSNGKLTGKINQTKMMEHLNTKLAIYNAGRAYRKTFIDPHTNLEYPSYTFAARALGVSRRTIHNWGNNV